MDYAGRITVENASGVRFQLHEFRGRRFFKVERRYRLETGEAVRRLDFDHYIVAKTGETLVRLAR